MWFVVSGGWRRINEECDLKGGINISFECADGSNCYLAAMDNGRFTIGGPHMAGEGPNPEEVCWIFDTWEQAGILSFL